MPVFYEQLPRCGTSRLYQRERGGEREREGERERDQPSGACLTSFRAFHSNSCLHEMGQPMSSESGTCKTVKARLWPGLSGKSPKKTFQVVSSLLGSGCLIALLA